MKPKTIAYIIVYKPTTSKTWTPVTYDVHPYLQDYLVSDGCWFYKRADAQYVADKLNGFKINTYLYGARKWDVFEFKVAEVRLA